MSTLEEIRSKISGTRPEEWIPFAEMGVWTYRSEVELRIERHEKLDSDLDVPWTQHLQAKSPNYSYLVYYGNSPVEYHQIASVDNFRAHIPLPQQPAGPNEPYTITPYQATLGRLITGDQQTFEAYLNNTGIQIQK